MIDVRTPSKTHCLHQNKQIYFNYTAQVFDHLKTNT